MTKRSARQFLAPLALAAALALTGCTGVGVSEAPDSGSAAYQVWGLNEASSQLTGADRSVVLNGDLDNDSKAFFTAEGSWGAAGFALDDASTERVRELADTLPERTGDPNCVRLVLVDGGLLGNQAVATIAIGELPDTGQVTATALG
jgi:hypothetical protein